MMIEEELSNLTINHLTEEQYMNAKANGDINENELYMTPDDGNYGEGGIIVSPTEPTTDRRKVWLQKGKNLFDCKNAIYLNAYINAQANNVTPSDKDRGHYFSYIQCQPNTTYTISKILSNSFRIATFTNKPKIGTIYNTTEANHTGTSMTITTGENDNYLGFVCFSVYDGDTGTYEEMYNTVQIECGTEATEYEEYINPAIYVKNDNDEYEEFIKKNIVRNSKVESTEEAYSCNYINSSLEIEKIEGFFVVKPGYTILFDKIFKQGKHYFGNLIVKKNSGNFTNIQEAVATPSKTLNGNYNTGCFLANNIYASHAIGYCYFGENVVYIADQNEKGYNIAKMNVDIVVN